MKKKTERSFHRFVTLALVLISVFLNFCSNDNGTEPKAPTTFETEEFYKLSIYEVNVRQYSQSGSFADFETHLERLKDLGVGILWFMPIHPIGEKNRLGSLGSYYSVKNYYDVNPEFGTLGGFKSLVKKIHNIGMYVIIDWVANHTSWDNALTVEHPEYYAKDANGNFMPPPRTNWSDVIELDYNNEELRKYMIDVMKFWVEETDIDGFRFDAVSFVPLNFWEEAIMELRKSSKSLFLLAEAEGKQYYNAGFDMTYSWELFHIINDVSKGYKNVYNIDAYLRNESSLYPDNSYRMYFTSNHDENSWNGTVFERLSEGAGTFAVLTSMLNGMPLIYSGQEAGLNKRLKFFDKDLIPWKDHEFFELYKTLNELKLNNEALWSAGFGSDVVPVNTTKASKVFAFIREKNDKKVFVVLNLSDSSYEISFQDDLFVGDYVDVFSNTNVSFADTSKLKLDAWKYKVYVKQI